MSADIPFEFHLECARLCPECESSEQTGEYPEESRWHNADHPRGCIKLALSIARNEIVERKMHLLTYTALPFVLRQCRRTVHHPQYSHSQPVGFQGPLER